MRKVFYWVLLGAMIVLAYSASAAGGSKKKKKTASSKKTTTSAASKSKKKSGSKRPAVTWRNRQLQPTPQRYKEIQEALAAKGYMPSEEATGSWGPASTDALKRFQADQNLESTGKINSLSLIALGLGPKRENVSAVKPPSPPQDPPAPGK